MTRKSGAVQRFSENDALEQLRRSSPVCRAGFDARPTATGKDTRRS